MIDGTIQCTYAMRTEEGTPRLFRYARYPDGSVRLQGGYVWQEGWSGGVTWRDVGTVDVGEDGLEVT